MTTDIKNIDIQSRATLSIDRATYIFLERDRDFERLVVGGVFSLTRSRTTPFGLKAGPYVGSALLSGGVRLQITEKETGSLKALIAWASPPDFRDAEVLSAGKKDAEIILVLAMNFLASLGLYLRRGRLKEYNTDRNVSTKPRGKLDLRATLALRARGHAPELVSRQQNLTGNIAANQLLSFALGKLISVFSSLNRKPETVQALNFAHAFSDVTTTAVQNMPHDERRTLFSETLELASSFPELRGALRDAQPFLFDGGLGVSNPDFILPRSYFLNLETLFEEATRNVASELLQAHGIVVAKGSLHKKSLFGPARKTYIADPDLIASYNAKVLLVGDCKYKIFSEKPDHGDVYQILAHATACDTKIAALFVPGQTNQVVELGRTANDISLFVAALRPAFLREDIKAFLDKYLLAALTSVDTVC